LLRVRALTPEQMRLANALSRLAEMAETASTSELSEMAESRATEAAGSGISPPIGVGGT
jgi:hypothetical protein